MKIRKPYDYEPGEDGGFFYSPYTAEVTTKINSGGTITRTGTITDVNDARIHLYIEGCGTWGISRASIVGFKEIAELRT